MVTVMHTNVLQGNSDPSPALLLQTCSINKSNRESGACGGDYQGINYFHKVLRHATCVFKRCFLLCYINYCSVDYVWIDYEIISLSQPHISVIFNWVIISILSQMWLFDASHSSVTSTAGGISNLLHKESCFYWDSWRALISYIPWTMHGNLTPTKLTINFHKPWKPSAHCRSIWKVKRALKKTLNTKQAVLTLWFYIRQVSMM